MKKLMSILTTTMFCLYSLPLFAQEELPPARDQGIWQTLIMMAIFFVFFYLILFRPEQKRRKAMNEMRSQLTKGDRVTAMGIVGTVVRVQENTVILKMWDGTKIEMLKDAISEVASGTEEDVKKIEREEAKLEKTENKA